MSVTYEETEIRKELLSTARAIRIIADEIAGIEKRMEDSGEDTRSLASLQHDRLRDAYSFFSGALEQAHLLYSANNREDGIYERIRDWCITPDHLTLGTEIIFSIIEQLRTGNPLSWEDYEKAANPGAADPGCYGEAAYAMSNALTALCNYKQETGEYFEDADMIVE